MGIKPTRQSGNKAADAKNQRFVPGHVYADAGSQGIVLSNSFEGLAYKRTVQEL